MQHLQILITGYVGQHKPLPWFSETAYQWLAAAPEKDQEKATKSPHRLRR